MQGWPCAMHVSSNVVECAILACMYNVASASIKPFLHF